MALGPYPLISLALAREKQADIRRLILEGVNPAEKRRGKAGWRAPLYVRVRGARMGLREHNLVGGTFDSVIF